MKVEASVDIKAPIGQVFEVFTDLDKLSDRIDGITSIEVLKGRSPLQVGTKWKETRQMFGKTADETMWVTELNHNQNYVVEAESHGTKYRSEYTFVESSEVTNVKLVFEGKPVTLVAKILAVLFSFMTKKMKEMLLADMTDLKKVCEHS